MRDFEAPIGSWPFWRASIIVALVSGLIGAFFALMM